MKRLVVVAAALGAALCCAGPAAAREFSPGVARVEQLVAAGRHAEAHKDILRILAAAEAAKDDLAVAEASGSLGGVLVGLGDMDGAGVALKRAWDLRERRLGPDHADTLFAVNDYAVWLSVQGRDPEAEPLLARVIAGLEAKGAEAGDIADARYGHGMVLFRLGAWTRGEAALLDAIPVLERTPGKEVAYSSALIQLADAYVKWGRPADALPWAEKALANDEAHMGRDHPNLVGIWVLLGQTRLSLGQWEAAEAAHLHAVGITQKAFPNGGVYVEHALGALAGYYSALGRREEAAALWGRVTEAQAARGDRSARAGEHLRLMAETLRQLGRLDEARAAGERALAIVEAARGPDSDMAGQTHVALAEIANDRGDLAEGEARARRALAIYEKSLTPDNPRLAEPLALLAFAARERSDHAEARRLYARAEQATARREPYHPQATSSRGLLAQEILAAGGDPSEAWRYARMAADGAEDRILSSARMSARPGAVQPFQGERTAFLSAVAAGWGWSEQLRQQQK